jgi:hypothetical protein
VWVLLLAIFRPLLGTVDVHDLVAAAENRHPRAAVDQWLSHGERGEHPERRRAQCHSLRKHRGAAPDILAHAPEVDADVAVAHDRHRLGTLVGVLLPHHGVGAVGQRRAGEDPGALAWPEPARRKRARGELLDHTEPHRPLGRRAADVVAARRVAVHGRVGPGGDVDRAHDVLGEHAVERVVERDPQGGLAAHVVEDAARGLGGREQRAHPSIA